MSAVVTCSRCRMQAAEDQTTFSPTGDILCQRCTDVADLNQQLDRAREEALAKAGQRGGLGGIIAHRVAVADHARLVAGMPNLDAGQASNIDASQRASCSRCGVTVPRGELVYDSGGRLICARCEVSASLNAAQAEVAGNFGLGFAAGLFGSIIGVAAAYGMGAKAQTRKGAMVGFGVELLAGAAALAWIALR